MKNRSYGRRKYDQLYKGRLNVLIAIPFTYEIRHEISNSVVCATSKAPDQPAQSDQSLRYSLEYSVSVKLLTEYHSLLAQKEAAQARLSLHYIVGNHIRRLIYTINCTIFHATCLGIIKSINDAKTTSHICQYNVIRDVKYLPKFMIVHVIRRS